MGDRDIIVFGTSAGETSRRRTVHVDEEEELFRMVWRNSERRKAERLSWNEPGYMKAARVAFAIVVAFLSSVGLFAVIALLL